jgi:hypothetical protein
VRDDRSSVLALLPARSFVFVPSLSSKTTCASPTLRVLGGGRRVGAKLREGGETVGLPASHENTLQRGSANTLTPSFYTTRERIEWAVWRDTIGERKTTSSERQGDSGMATDGASHRDLAWEDCQSRRPKDTRRQQSLPPTTRQQAAWQTGTRAAPVVLSRCFLSQSFASL